MPVASDHLSDLEIAEYARLTIEANRLKGMFMTNYDYMDHTGLDYGSQVDVTRALRELDMLRVPPNKTLRRIGDDRHRVRIDRCKTIIEREIKDGREA